jgi:hypothetical protein
MDPLDLGGEESIRNAIICCPSCNIKKGHKSFIVWLQQLPPRCGQLSENIYTAKHGMSPARFKHGPPTIRAGEGCIDIELLMADEID